MQDATVREWKRQMLAKSEEATVSGSGKRRTVVESKEPSVKPTVAPNASDAAGPADALASMERKVAELQARLDELDADVERQRREKRELDIEIAIRKGALELLGKEPGADPENLTNREKTLLVKTAGETLGVTARSLLPVVGIARSTYHYQLKSRIGFVEKLLNDIGKIRRQHLAHLRAGVFDRNGPADLMTLDRKSVV